MEEKVTGVMIYYYFVCKRKLWYFCHEIRMEAENEDVLLGKLLDESSYGKNEKHINIDNVINIDFIRDQKCTAGLPIRGTTVRLVWNSRTT